MTMTTMRDERGEMTHNATMHDTLIPFKPIPYIPILYCKGTKPGTINR